MPISSLVTGANIEASNMRVLDRVSSICYLIQFRKDKGKDVLALLDSWSKVNAMILAYTAHLGLKVKVTNVGVQKIDGSSLATYGMVIAAFQIVDKLSCSRFFQETFLLANISIKVVLGMPFLTLSNVDIQFAEKKLTWKTYTTKEALPITCLVEIINQKEFAKAALDDNIDAFVVYVSSLELRMSIHPARKAQLALLLTKEVIVPTKYWDFADVLLEKSANVLSERTRANKHAIELEEGKELSYEHIHSLEPVEFETFKTYIKTNLANGFIRVLKSLVGAAILLLRKPNSSFRLCVNYWGLNNLPIKNQYPLLLIGEFLDRLGQAKQFTQLDFTSAYHWMRIKEGNEWKTALQTWYSHFEYQVMHFGLSNALASC